MILFVFQMNKNTHAIKIFFFLPLEKVNMKTFVTLYQS